MDRAIGTVSTVIHTQRKSLQRITDERAEAQDKLIQERIVQERQRLARELHDSVSQQLFAASMLLSAITESNEDAVAQKPLLQVERIVQQAQLEMRALLLHLRPAALNNKSLAEGLEELLVELREKVLFDIRFRLEEVHYQKGRKIIYSELRRRRYPIHCAMHKQQKSIFYSSNEMGLRFSACKIMVSDLRIVTEKAVHMDYKTLKNVQLKLVEHVKSFPFPHKGQLWK